MFVMRIARQLKHSLSEAMKAQEQVATGHTRGKIVLKVADEPK
jgi:hypothetical protein